MTRIEPWHIGVALFPCLVLLHLIVSPYTKVEESFNIQATHDILTYGVPLPTQNVYLRLKAQYDHMEFPGAVPRTFIGALVVAGIAQPILWLRETLDGQMVARGILGGFNALSMISYAFGVRRAFGKSVAAWFVLFQACQFHLFYYASRTLPNMFAFGMSTFALRYLLPEPGVNAVTRVKRTRLALYLLTTATVIFRAELGLLIAAQCLYLLWNAATNEARRTLLTRTIIPAGLSGAIVGLALTVPIDTFFWQSDTPIWSELSAFLSNVFPPKDSLGASAWGTSPWHWYITSALPRLLLNPLALPLLAYSVINGVVRPSSIPLLIPPLLYTALYSILPHKETRFLFPILPPLTTALALATNRLTSTRPDHRSTTTISSLLRTIILTSTLLTALTSHLILLPLSSLNYPGALALSTLHTHAHNTQPHLHIHLDNLSLQTGITLFHQFPTVPSTPLLLLPGRLAPGGRYTPEYHSGDSGWTYDKSDNDTQLLDPAFWAAFDYVIVAEPGLAIGAWDVVDVVYGLGRPRVVRPRREQRDEEEEGENEQQAGVVKIPEQWTREETVPGLLEAMYGERVGGWGGRVYEGVKAVVYEKEWTGGYWVEWGLERKLYVLKRGYAVRVQHG